MEKYPGLQPWHFGGEERYTWGEARAIVDHYEQYVEETKKQQKEMEKQQRTSSRKR